jgi:hypothetical protein
MKYIITEEQNLRVKILRRLGSVHEIINNELSYFYSQRSKYQNLCKYDLEDFITIVIQWICEKMYYDYFSDIDDTSEEWSSIHNIIVEYIESVHFKTIKHFYNKKCSK